MELFYLMFYIGLFLHNNLHILITDHCLLTQLLFKPIEYVLNQSFRDLFCSAHVFHGRCYNGKFTLIIA